MPVPKNGTFSAALCKLGSARLAFLMHSLGNGGPMRRCIYIAILGLLASCSQGPDSPSISAVLQLHNQERSAVSVPPLTWSDALAQQAESWGKQCDFEHSNGSTGENLYVTSSSRLSDPQVLADAAESWAAEK